MIEVHEGSCGTHACGSMLAKKIMRTGYCWLTMKTDCIQYTKKCHECQIYADLIKAPPTPLFNMTAPWPFSMWGIDVIGLIHLKASKGHQFILVAFDYFTKWVEAASYASVTSQAVAKFLQKEIICCYGQSEAIVTDNGSNLNNRLMSTLCETY